MAEQRDPEFATTVAINREGVSPDRAPPPPARLTCTSPSLLNGPEGQVIALEKGAIRVGRGDTSDAVINADSVSRIHARLFPGDGVWGIEDLKSSNGIKVNGARVERVWLDPGDTVMIGGVSYAYLTQDLVEANEDGIPDVEKTLVIRPTVKQADPPRPQPQKQGAELEAERTLVMRPASPANRATTASRRTPEPEARGSSSGLWIGIAIAAALLILGWAFLA